MVASNVSECRFFGKVNGALSFATLGPPKGKHDPGRYEKPSPSESLLNQWSVSFGELLSLPWPGRYSLAKG
jgi:hypothetical protein